MGKASKGDETTQIGKRKIIDIPDEFSSSEAPSPTPVNWRTPINPFTKQRAVIQFYKTLMLNVPFEDQDELQDLAKVAISIEDRIYAAATSSEDYSRRVSLKLSKMWAIYRNPLPNSLRTMAEIRGLNARDTFIIAPPPDTMCDPTLGNCDWKTRVHTDYRADFVNQIAKCLNTHPYYSQQQQDCYKIALDVEARSYAAATTNLEYLKNLSSEVIRLVFKSPLPWQNSLQPNAPPAGRVHDWRLQLHPSCREKCANRILGIMRELRPNAAQGDVENIRRAVIRFEEKVYATSTNRDEYSRRMELEKLYEVATEYYNSQAPASNSVGDNTRVPPNEVQIPDEVVDSNRLED